MGHDPSSARRVPHGHRPRVSPSCLMRLLPAALLLAVPGFWGPGADPLEAQTVRERTEREWAVKLEKLETRSSP
jgi:hypothetical protein